MDTLQSLQNAIEMFNRAGLEAPHDRELHRLAANEILRACRRWMEDGFPQVPPVTPPVLLDVVQERRRQDQKWGEQNHGDGFNLRLDAAIHDDVFFDLEHATVRDFGDYVERAGRSLLEDGVAAVDTWAGILLEEVGEALTTPSREELRKKLIQVAAVCVAWVEDLDRR